MTDSASDESDDKTAMNQTQDNLPSGNIEIVNLEDVQSDHKLELVDTQILPATQAITDYNDNIEPPKCPTRSILKQKQ